MRRRRALFAIGVACLVAMLVCRAGAPQTPPQPGPKTGPETEKRFPPLKLPAGFKATLFACDPLVEYPSVISIGPRPGAIFVAYDYMTGLGLDHVRRDEIRLVEDTDGDGYADKATVFAKGFNSIQGLAYRDGALYVMHAPFLTVLRDTKKSGVADERKDLLTGLGLTPEKNKVLLHCANGVVVGHDGWLYLAIGDNGVDVPRPEGDRLVLHGGGILRCRPDGRDLHVFSSGLRNIYDIALDAEQNVFVRDNENDGGTYMIRVCHSFHGADHGYPYLYDARPEEALPPIGDFGLGSSAGGVCYLETQFPRKHRGNLFFCEWGKSVVRYPLARAGSGFAPVKEVEFAAGDSKDAYPFKPTDIVVQRDGTMMVADFADGQRPKRGRGRIYRIAYLGNDAGSGDSKTGLDSESYFERCEAQAALERGGDTPKQLGPRGRMHAIWASAHMNGAKSIDDLLRIAATDTDPSVRAQAVRAIADLADPVFIEHKLDAGPGDVRRAEQLAALARGQEPRVILEIVVALGRLRWSRAPAWLNENLVRPDAALSHAAMQTMRRSANWPAILALLDQVENAPSHAIALRALAERYEPAAVDGLIARLGTEKNAERRRAYADALARTAKKPGPWKYWGYRPGPRPANTETWERTAAIEAALDGVLADPDRALRLAVLRSMQREQVPAHPARLGAWLEDEHQPERAAAILAFLSGRSAAVVQPSLRKVVGDREHSADNRRTALALLVKSVGEAAPVALLDIARRIEDGPVLADLLSRLGEYPDPAATSLLLEKAKSADPAVRAAAVESLGNLRADDGRELVLRLLHDREPAVRGAAARAAGKLTLKDASASLLKLTADADDSVRRASFDSLRLVREPRAVPLALAAMNQRALEQPALALVGELGGPENADAVAAFAKRNPSSDSLAAAVRALTGWRDRNGLAATQQSALDRAVAEVQGASGIVVHWVGVGPMPRTEGPRFVEQFAAAGKSPAAGRSLFATGAEGRVVLAASGDANDAVRFAQSDLAVAEATPVEFLASSRGDLHVWLNGKPLYRRNSPGGYRIDSDRFDGRLEPGNNRLLVQTASANAAVEFHLRFRRKSARAEHEKLTLAALSRAGSAERGSQVFFDKEKSLCLKCHRLGDQGERIGPELTGVGGRFSRIHLVESILEPSRTIAPSFDTLVVALKNGKAASGVKIAETATTLTLADNQGQIRTLQVADIDELGTSAVSTMPDGLERRLTEDEFVDLIAFLASRNRLDKN